MGLQAEPAPLAGRLIALRRAAGLTQEEVAVQLGIGRSAYAYYETGGSLPTLDSLSRLATVFGVTADYLLGRAELPVDHLTVGDVLSPEGERQVNALAVRTKNEKTMLMWFRQLSAEEQEVLIRRMSSHCLGNESGADGLLFSE